MFRATFKKNLQHDATLHGAALGLLQHGGADERRPIEPLDPHPLPSAGAQHTLTHSYAHSCLSARSPAGSSRATQDATQKGLQSAADNRRHKDPESHNSVMSKSRPGGGGLR